jgi:hypothetical protein
MKLHCQDQDVPTVRVSKGKTLAQPVMWYMPQLWGIIRICEKQRHCSALKYDLLLLEQKIKDPKLCPVKLCCDDGRSYKA